MTDDLVAFLRARLDDDEQVARAATPGPWMWIAGRVYQEAELGRVVVPTDDLDRGLVEPEDLKHIARHDPARVLREVDAKRQILNAYEWALAHPHKDDETGYWVRKGETSTLAEDVRLLASVYADHPDFRDEWRL